MSSFKCCKVTVVEQVYFGKITDGRLGVLSLRVPGAVVGIEVNHDKGVNEERLVWMVVREATGGSLCIGIVDVSVL